MISKYIKNGIKTDNGNLKFHFIDYECITRIDSTHLVDCGFKYGYKEEVQLIRNMFFHIQIEHTLRFGTFNAII